MSKNSNLDFMLSELVIFQFRPRHVRFASKKQVWATISEMGKVERSVGTVLVLFMRVKSVATQMVQNPTSMGNATRVKRVDTEGVIMVGRIAPRFGIC